MIVSIISNFVVGKLIAHARQAEVSTTGLNAGGTREGVMSPRTYLAIGVIINVGLLVSFK